MKVVIEEYRCDVCETKLSNGVETIPMSVIFTTEQIEGYGVKPYITSAKLHLCGKCLGVVLSGKQIFARGAMGNNHYYFTKDV